MFYRTLCSLFLITSISPLSAADLTLKDALASIDQSNPTVRFNKELAGQFVQRKLSECQEKMLQPVVFDAPHLTCGAEHLVTPQQRQEMLVMRRYFDVLLADERAGLENEALAIAFIDFDRTQTRMEQGQRSELDVSKFQARYQPVRVRFSESEKSQRLSRELLALAQDKAGELSVDLEKPDLANWLIPPAEETLAMIDRALAANPVLLQYGTSGQVTPVYLLLRDQLRYTILEIRQILDVMLIEIEAAQAQFDYRSLYLDRSRTLYELEVKADLGDSMVEQTSARLKQHEMLYALAMLRATLNALQGLPLDNGLQQEKEE